MICWIKLFIILVKYPVSLIDIFPTVLECVGAQPKPEDSELPGTSLWKFAKGKHHENRPIFAENHAVGFSKGVFMLRHGDYKLVYYIDDHPQLFNLRQDPGELDDLAQDERYRDTLKQMEAELRKICDPEAVDAQAKCEQNTLLEHYGGKEAVLGHESISYSPVPKGVI